MLSQAKIFILFSQFLHFLFSHAHFLDVRLIFNFLLFLILFVVGAAKSCSQGNAVHFKLLGDVLSNKSHIVVFENFPTVHEKYKVRWPDSGL